MTSLRRAPANVKNGAALSNPFEAMVAGPVRDVRVHCVNKTDRAAADDRIHHVGGINVDGSRWKLSEDEVIAAINQRRWTFWMDCNGKSVRVIVVKDGRNREFLKTEIDGAQPDSLLALPECP